MMLLSLAVVVILYAVLVGLEYQSNKEDAEVVEMIENSANPALALMRARR